jgi:hypothetical protein
MSSPLFLLSFSAEEKKVDMKMVTRAVSGGSKERLMPFTVSSKLCTCVVWVTTKKGGEEE